MVDVYKYIKSKDMLKAFKSEDYKFRPIEAAYIISYSGEPLEKIVNLYKDILEESEDEELKCKNDIEEYRTFHGFLKATIDKYQELVGKVNDNNSSNFYAKTDIDCEEEFSSLEEALSDANFKYNPVVVRKTKNEGDLELIFNKDKQLIDIRYSEIANTGKHAWALAKSMCEFPVFEYSWPCPFKEGDIIKHIHGKGLSVITDISHQQKDKTKELFGDISIDYSSRFEKISIIDDEFYIGHGHTIAYEKASEEEIENAPEFLLHISDYLKGESTFGTVVGELSNIL